MKKRNLMVVGIIVLIILVIYCTLPMEAATFTSFNDIPIPKVIHKVFIQHNGTLDGAFTEKNINDAHNSWIEKNPGYKIKYWGLEDCRKFIYKHFGQKYLDNFDCIQAYSGKSDFFRYCIIYIQGGWYSDWKQVCLKNNLLDTIGKNKIWVSCWDKASDKVCKNQCMMTAFFGAPPKSPVLKKALEFCTNNVNNKYYGTSSLHPTGPCLFGNAFRLIFDKYSRHRLFRKRRYPENIYLGTFNNKWIFYDNNNDPIILHKCEGCGQNQDWKLGNNYLKLWNEKKFYC